MRNIINIPLFAYRCKSFPLPRGLPQISVIAVYDASSLELIPGFVASFVRYTPAQHLKEILLVEDGGGGSHCIIILI